MTVTLASAGSPTSATGSATAPAPVFPATVNAGQYAVLVVNIKLWSATCSTPSGWTALGDSTNGSTDGVVNTGSTRVAVFGKTCDGTEDGTTVTLTITGGNSSGAVIHTFDTSLGGWDTPVLAFGSKVGNSANMSAASSTQTSVAAGDLFVIGYAMNASLGTPSSDTLTQTGVTFGTVTNRSDVAITTGNDSRNRVDTVPVTSVTTPSGGATAGYTNASSTSGTVAFLRLRDIASGPNVGTVTGAVSWVGVANGARASSGSASGAVAWVGVANGTRASRGAATGAVTWSGATNGARASRGATSGDVAWVGSTNGARTSRGNATGAVAWVGVANGVAPVTGTASGNAAGSISWSGVANGSRRSAGASTGAITWAGVANGKRNPAGAAVAAITWAGAALGKFVAKGAAAGLVTWTGIANGPATASIPARSTGTTLPPVQSTDTASTPVISQDIVTLTATSSGTTTRI